MTKDEALDLALEALEKSVATCFDRCAHEQVMSRPEHFINQAITAIKQARALDKMAENARELGLDYEPAPVQPFDHQQAANTALRESMHRSVAIAKNTVPTLQKRPPNCGTGYCSCVECVMEPAPVPMAHIVGEIDHNGKVWAPAQPAVPDAFGTREGEHPQYVQGWNDCRAETLKMRKP